MASYVFLNKFGIKKSAKKLRETSILFFIVGCFLIGAINLYILKIRPNTPAILLFKSSVLLVYFLIGYMSSFFWIYITIWSLPTVMVKIITEYFDLWHLLGSSTGASYFYNLFITAHLYDIITSYLLLPLLLGTLGYGTRLVAKFVTLWIDDLRGSSSENSFDGNVN